MRRRHIWVVIAAYNEVGVIARVVGEVRQCGYTVLLIDDGSTDATAATAEKAGAVVIRHPVNLGQGAALQTGIEYALREGADVIVTFDADGQHRVADIDVLIDAMASITWISCLAAAFSAAPSIYRRRGGSYSRRRPGSRASPAVSP